MMKWTAEEIKILRLSLGWSAAAFSQRFGCGVELVLDWERGAQRPSPDDILQLNRLEFHLQSYSEQVACNPIADHALIQMGLEQICQTDIRDLNKRS